MEFDFNVYDPASWKYLSKKRTVSKEDILQIKTPSKDFWDEISKDYDELERCDDYLKMMNSVIDKLRGVGAIHEGARVLDIGCGTGNYAVKFAPHVKEVICIDISEKMLEVLRNKVEKSGLKNITIINADWSKLDIDEMGFKGAFDLVFASMTPLTSDLDLVDKMLSSSKRYLCIISWAGVKENKLLQEITLKLWGKSTQNSPDMIITFNYLYSLGFAPHLDFYHGTWQKSKELNSYLSYLLKILNNIKKLENDDIILVKRYLEEINKDGVIISHTKVRIASMLIDVTKRKG